MQKVNIGILHPGEMGVSIAASVKNSGHPVYWVSQGRSPETRRRAESQWFLDAGDLAALCRACPVIISVLPPHAAEEAARQVLEAGFRGLYLDANAISPQRARRMAHFMAEAGVEFVDGGIIGGPAWQPGRTWLYLSGPQAGQAAEWFSAGPLETSVIGPEPGKASALKMCYAAYSKGTTALLCAVLGTAEALGVRPELEAEWSRDGSNFAAEAAQQARRVTAKAWRFAGEMDEISATFAGAGLPGAFHAGAAEVYRRLAPFKESPDLPSLEEVLRALGDLPWYHGSPLHLTSLRPGSTITRDRRLAEVFSHKPPVVAIDDDGAIRHNGTQPGFLYRVAEAVSPADVSPHPRSSMQPGLEWLTRRELKVELLGPAPLGAAEILTEEEISALRKRRLDADQTNQD